ncbi:MAG: site-specific integrase [Acetatifactor sp.]|nr:site-specific integrase [Acetatifactor sp.]
MDLSDRDLLNYAIENGMIDVNTIRANIEMNERKKFLKMHESRIWVGKDGRWATYLPDRVKGRKLVKKTTEKDLEDLIIEYYKAEEVQVFIDDVFDAWIKSKVEYGEIEKQTADRYKTDYKKFFVDHEITKTEVRYITEDMLEDFIKSSIHKHELTAKSWGNLRVLICGIFKHAKKRGLTNISITNFMGDLELSRKAFKRKVLTDEESVFTDREIEDITDYIKKSQFSVINLGILLCFQTGLRAGELSSLKYSDLTGNILNVTRTEITYQGEGHQRIFEVREFTKGRDGYRKVVLTKQAIAIIKELYLLNPTSEFLFVRDGQRIKGKAFSKKLKSICDHVGIKPRSLHKIRKTYGTKLLGAGVDDKLIEKQMGHTNIATTRQYYYYNNKEMVDVEQIITSAIN